jgi:hypothetical protein
MNLSEALALIPHIHEVVLRETGMKPFDNYNFRTVAVASILKKDLWPDLHVSRKRTGIDASSKEHGLLDIEFKTTQGSSFMWDKQLEEVRRRQTLASDAFVFGIFEKEILKTILVATEEVTLEHIRDLMRKKQAERIQVWEGKIAAGERGGTDAITITLKELYVTDVPWKVWHF